MDISTGASSQLFKIELQNAGLEEDEQQFKIYSSLYPNFLIVSPYKII